MKGIGRTIFVVLAAALMGLCLSGAALAAQPITFGYDGIAKIGETYDSGPMSAGQHAIAFEQDTPYGSTVVSSIFAAWVSGYSVLYAEGWDHGKDWSPASVIATESGDVYGTSMAITPVSASYPNGIVHVVWYSDTDRVVKYASNSGPRYYRGYWEQPVIVNAGGMEGSAGQSVAADSAGNAYVAWDSSTDGNIRVSKIVNNAVVATTLVNQPGFGGHWPSVAVDPAGNIHVAWYGSSGIYYSKSMNGGVSFSPQTLVNGTYVGGYPSLAVYDSNKIYIAWGSNGAVVCAYTSNGGSSWGQSVVSSSGRQPSLAVSPNGDVNVAFVAYTSNPYNPGDGIYLSRSTTGGSTWGTPALVYLWGETPHLAVDPTNNKALIMWTIGWYSSGPEPLYGIDFNKEK